MKIPHKMRRSKSYKNKTLGQGLVEFSLILPVLLFILLGIIDYGRILLVFSNSSNSIRNATRQGTLVGNIQDASEGNVPRYMACATIADYANNVFGADIQQVDILYFSTENFSDPDNPTAAEIAARAALATTLETLDPNDPTNTFGGNTTYSCSGADGTTKITEDSLETGDLMVILVSARIEFITPFLSSMFPDFEITFRSQRTIVESLVLNVNGADIDGDGLLDQYEFERFGCVLANTNDFDNPVYLLPDTSLTVNVGNSWAYLDPTQSNWDNGTPDDLTTAADEYLAPPNALITPTDIPGIAVASSYSIPGDCAREDISKGIFDSLVTDAAQFNADFDHLQCETATDDADETTYTNCIIISTGLFSSTNDPDGDNCNNGCEEARQTNPFDYLNTYAGEDTDGDGLTDAAEIGGGTDPNVRDSDGDGLWDGTERCEFFDENDPTVCISNPVETQALIDDGVTYSYYGDWSNTDPDNADSDGDGAGLDPGVLNDGYEHERYNPGTDNHLDPNDDDTDDDGLNDGREIEGFELTLTINGLTGTATYYTATGNGDSDNDGRSDREEVEGYIVKNAAGDDITVQSSPQDQDTDDDGVCDGDGVGDTFCPTRNGSAVADINPLESDTDRDGLSDYEEQITHGTLADNTNSDSDVCNLTDTYEMLSDDATTNDDPLGADVNADNEGGVNALDLSSDTDGISDCDEATIYGSNPYNPDTDGDLYPDDKEIDPANWCLDILRPDAANLLPCDGGTLEGDAGNGVAGAGDGYNDAWERLYFPDENTYDLALQADIDIVNALDSDGCDIACEYRNGTDPTMTDTDLDGLNDLYESDTGNSGTSPVVADSDGDLLIDGREGATSNVCIDATLLNTSTSGTFGASDCYDTFAYNPDTDGDGLSDGDEVNGSTIISVDSGSGFANVVVTSDPLLRDTDNDNLTDGEEVNGVSVTTTINGTVYTVTVKSDPDNVDTDGDGRTDYQETKLNFTYANVFDTDGDGIPDGSHFDGVNVIGELSNYFDSSIPTYNTNPLDIDSDDDGLTDLQEVTGFNITVILYDLLENQISSMVVSLAGYDPSNPNDPSLDPNNGDIDSDSEKDGDETTDTGVNDWVTNPLVANTDGDTAANDGLDNCPVHANNDQSDSDNDGLGDVCDGNVTATYVFVDPMTDVSSLSNSTEWIPSVTVRAVDNIGDTHQDVQITVTFTDPNNGDAIVGTAQTCTTLASGLCSAPLSLPAQLRTLEELDVTVTTVANPPTGLTYDSSRNIPLAGLTLTVPPLSVEVDSIVPSLVAGSTSSSWEVDSLITIVDSYSNPVQGATIDVVLRTAAGSTGGTVIDSVTCSSVTDVNGQCTVRSNVLTNANSVAWVRVNDIPNASTLGLVFDSAHNSEDINAPAPPAATTVYVDSITDNSTLVSSSQWSPSVIVGARDDVGTPRSGVTITVEFRDSGNALLGTDTCQTLGTGLCPASAPNSAAAPNQARSTTPVTATVTNMTIGGLAYDAPSNNITSLPVAVPQLLVRVSDVAGSAVGADNSAWSASAVITVIDTTYNDPVNGQQVQVRFAGTTTTPADVFCTTSGAGTCTATLAGTPFDAGDTSVAVSIINIIPSSGYGVGTPNDTDTIPAPPAPAGGITVQSRINNDGNNQSSIYYQLINTGSSAITNVSARLYFIPESGYSASDYVLTRDYESSGNPQVNPTGPISAGGGRYYFEIDYGSRSFPASATWQYQMRLYLGSYSNDYSANNDWWYTGITGSYTDTTYLPVYINGTLEVGDEPPIAYEYVTEGTTNGLEVGNDWTATLINLTVSNASGPVGTGRSVNVSYTTVTKGGGAGSSGTDSCDANTNGSGQCTITVTGLRNNGNNNIVCTVTFTVTGITGNTDVYDSAENIGFPVTVNNPNGSC